MSENKPIAYKQCPTCGEMTRPPWQGYCDTCRNSYQRRRYRNRRREAGFEVYGREERQAQEALFEQAEELSTNRQPLGPPEVSDEEMEEEFARLDELYGPPPNSED